MNVMRDGIDFFNNIPKSTYIQQNRSIIYK